MTIIDQPGECFIVNDEPVPGQYRSRKVVARDRGKYRIFQTVNDRNIDSWEQSLIGDIYDSPEDAKKALMEMIEKEERKVA